MRIAVPRMGNLPLIVEDLARRFDLDYIETPPFNLQTVELGAALAPEFACLPLKAVLGSFVQVLDLGADTLVMGGGHGPCRFGFYGEVQKRILDRMGREFRMIILDPPSASLSVFFHGIREVIPRQRVGGAAVLRELSAAMAKAIVFDEMEKWALACRGLAREAGSVDAALDESRRLLAPAMSRREVRKARREILEVFDAVAVERERPHLSVGLVGEIFVVLEPYFNFEVDTWLGRRGAVVERSCCISDTIYPGGRNPVFGHSDRRVARAAAPFLTHEVGGDGLLTVGAAVLFARRGFDAVVHLLPFTCMPEVIAKGVLSRVSSEMDMPVLSLSIDEQTGRAGVQTRLEALLDLAWSNRAGTQSESFSEDFTPRPSILTRGSGGVTREGL
ncbi:MAG: CoA protein activase [Actinobacteria bacterium]|nr:CoA protein activase [Actinomycetota bacterium]MBU1944405.1 CoA protein activase [Actinomycetota bacterium]MBU2688191.1 CoA protein activase [Actinomycetota bacterium]